MFGSNAHDACVICGGDVRQVHGAHEVRIGQRTVTLQSEHRQCSQCAERFFSPDQLDEIQKRASETVRREEGLLFPWDIRGIRTRLGLSQAQFERLLGAGPKTVVRWEKGTVFQNGATDSLLRVLAALPEAARILARHHGVSLARETVATGRIWEPAQRSYHYVAGPAQSNVLPFDRSNRPELSTVPVKTAAKAQPIYQEAIG